MGILRVDAQFLSLQESHNCPVDNIIPLIVAVTDHRGKRLLGNNHRQKRIFGGVGGNGPSRGQLGNVRSQEVTTPGKKGLGKLGSLFNHNRFPLHVVCSEKIRHIELGCGARQDANCGAIQFLGALDAQLF